MPSLWKIFIMVSLLLPLSVQAQTVEVQDAWIRGMVPAQKATGAFMNLTSKAPARLVAVESPVAKSAEIHNMRIENGVMKMFPAEGIDLPAGRTVKLAPGGYHIMLFDLKQPLRQGDQISLRLTFEMQDGSRQEIDIPVEVRNIKGEPMHKH